MTLRQGEQMLVALGIPVALLVFFSVVHVLPVGAHPVRFLAPGILALAVMSTSMVSLGIGTGFERGYGVLKRLGSTPLGRPNLLLAKTFSVLVVQFLQLVVLVPVAYGLGWRPGGAAGWTMVGGAVLGWLAGTAAFAGLGMLMAGTLKATATLALANGLYIVLLLLGGMVVPLSKLPAGLRGLAEVLPASALSGVLGGSLSGTGIPGRDWLVLGLWALAAPVAAAVSFRWE
jgi:ABC-2 type transport system permease protein